MEEAPSASAGSSHSLWLGCWDFFLVIKEKRTNLKDPDTQWVAQGRPHSRPHGSPELWQLPHCSFPPCPNPPMLVLIVFLKNIIL